MLNKNSSQEMSDQAKTGHVKSLRYLSKYILPYKYYVCFMLIALVVTSSSVLAIGKSLQYVIDQGLSKNDSFMLDKALFYLICIIVILALATCTRYYLVTLVGEKAIADIRRDIYYQTLKLSPSFFEINKPGEILSRLTTDTTLLQIVIGSSLSIVLRNTIMFVGGIILLATTSPYLTLIMSLVIPLVILPIIFFSKQMRKYAKLSQDKVAEISAFCEETISGIKIIQAYVREESEKNLFNKKLQEVINAALNRIKTRSILITIVISLVFGSIGFILWIGGHKVLIGEITAGELSSFLFLAVICAGSIGTLTDVIGDLQRAGGATERLVEYLNIKPEILEALDSKVLPKNCKGEIQFKNVTFYYPSRINKACLENLSLTIFPNKITAIVGESGAGKSTVFQLLLRFYDVSAGEILFDGIKINDLSLQSLRSQFAYVSQDPVIFSSSVYQNILYGNPNATEKEVITAAKAAAAFEFIEKLPNGFQTYLGEKGVRLSGGQKQRIAIARAILKNPKIFLLDEATSSLDAKNEQQVQQALENIMLGRTTIVIAHRLSTIRKADNIYVMKDGNIIEQGSHSNLFASNREYTRLVKLQMQENQ
jgi:ATP-binding cassette subfamily B protein